MFNCSVFDKVFTVKCNMLRHVKSHKQIKFTCGDCKQDFTRRSNLSDLIGTEQTWYVFYLILYRYQISD